ncbi:MAG: hypothetical protein JWM80_3055 [Cyanobacteria bacterium RYN_339]|nr:hypothetical protein [Cyanobacteria bacterium RYN_339]
MDPREPLHGYPEEQPEPMPQGGGGGGAGVPPVEQEEEHPDPTNWGEWPDQGGFSPGRGGVQW